MTCTSILHPSDETSLGDELVYLVWRLENDPSVCECYVRSVIAGERTYCTECLRRRASVVVEDQLREGRRILKASLQRAQAAERYTEMEQLEQARMRRETRAQQKRYISAKTRMKILRRDNFKCGWCGRSAEDHGVALHVDHQQPLSKGGTNVEENLWILCEDCNLAKGASLA